MNKITLFILCSSIIAVSKANLIDDISAKIAESVSDVKATEVTKIVKSLGSLEVSTGEVIPNCIKQHTNAIRIESCDQCEEKFVRLCNDYLEWRYTICNCQIPTFEHCIRELQDEDSSNKLSCSVCEDGFMQTCQNWPNLWYKTYGCTPNLPITVPHCIQEYSNCSG